MTVYTLHLSHRHGDDVTVYATEAQALAALDDYVIQFWSELDSRPMPSDPAERRRLYFDEMEAEFADGDSYAIAEASLDLNPNPTPPAPRPATPSTVDVALHLDDIEDNASPGIDARVAITRHGIEIYFTGYGIRTMDDGHGSPVFIEVAHGHPRVCVWSSIREEDPTFVIDLAGAAESLRAPEDE